MIRAVLDANVFVSAALSRSGTPAKVLDAWRAHQFSLVVSDAILQEIGDVLQYPHLRARHRWSKQHMRTFLGELVVFVIVVPRTSTLSGLVPDDSDHRYLECAVAGHAEYLVSGDRDLLSLGEYQGIRIMTPREFLDVLEQKSRV